MREQNPGNCEHCQKEFGYYLIHSGFNDSSYAYCEKCGKIAILDFYNKNFPEVSKDGRMYEEIWIEFEKHLLPCSCGGQFKKGATPRCPHCGKTLSAEAAAQYIEKNAPGTLKGWRWQRNWNTLYCIVIDNQAAYNNFKPSTSAEPSSS